MLTNEWGWRLASTDRRYYRLDFKASQGHRLDSLVSAHALQLDKVVSLEFFLSVTIGWAPELARFWSWATW